MNYLFSHWEVNGANVGSDNPITLGPITTDITVVAVYAQITHKVTFDSNPTGIVFTQPAGQGSGSSLTIYDGASLTIQVPNQVTV